MCRLWRFERLPETLKGRLSKSVSDTPGLVVRQDRLSVSAGDTVEYLVHLDKTSMLRDKTLECNDPAGVRPLRQKPINHSLWKRTSSLHNLGCSKAIMTSGLIVLQNTNRLTGNSQLLFFCMCVVTVSVFNISTLLTLYCSTHVVFCKNIWGSRQDTVLWLEQQVKH